MDLKPASQPASSFGFSTEISCSSLSYQNRQKKAVHVSNVQGEGHAYPKPAGKQQSVFNSSSQKSRCAWSRVRKTVPRYSDPKDTTYCSTTCNVNYQETSQSGASVIVYTQRPRTGLKKSLTVTKLLCVESNAKQPASTMDAVLMETNAENLNFYKAKVHGSTEGITDGSLKKRLDKDKDKIRHLTQSAFFTKSPILNQPEHTACGQRSLNSVPFSQLHSPPCESKHYFDAEKHQNEKKLLAIKTLSFDNGCLLHSHLPDISNTCSLIPSNFSRRNVTQGSISYCKKTIKAMNIQSRPSTSQNGSNTRGDIVNALATIATKDRHIQRHTAAEDGNDTLAMEAKIASETRSDRVCRSKAPNGDFISQTSSWPVKTLPILEKLELGTPNALVKERNTTSKIYTDNEEKSIYTGNLLSLPKRIKKRAKNHNSKNIYTRNIISCSDILDKSLPRYNCKEPNDMKDVQLCCARHVTNAHDTIFENRAIMNLNIDKHVDGTKSFKSKDILNTNKRGNENANEKCIKGKTMEPAEDCLEQEAVYKTNDNLSSWTQTKTVNMIPDFNGESKKLNTFAQNNDNTSMGGVNTSKNINLDTVSKGSESNPTKKESITLDNSQTLDRAIINGIALETKAQNASIDERAEVSCEPKTTVCTTVSVSDVSSTKSVCSNTADEKIKPKTMSLLEHGNTSGISAPHFTKQKILQPIVSYKVQEGAGTHEDRDVTIHQRDINTHHMHDKHTFRKNKKRNLYKRKARTSKQSYLKKISGEPSDYIERKSSNALISVSNGTSNFQNDGEVQSKRNSGIFLTKGSEESKSGANHIARFNRVKRIEKNMSNSHNKITQYEMVKNYTKSMRMRTRRKAADGIEPAYIGEKNNKQATNDVHHANIYHANAQDCPRGEDFEEMTEYEWVIKKVKDENMIEGVSMYERRLITNVTPRQRALVRSQPPFKIERPAHSLKVLGRLSRATLFPKRSMSHDYRPRNERIQVACRETAPCRIVDINLQAAASAAQARLEDLNIIPRRRKGRVALPIVLPDHFHLQKSSSSDACETSTPIFGFEGK
ncbi:hypothetical protein PoB_006873600 [Plakobranchus ocellatus]|uniref:Uncharacterized protein n=1 Tax=Plakobranchus ocellatus TaxID=259542 RepID=A0AAV4DDP4_9GAST|nr:hypothetical protein PoB_006873600 [Plakobranchus ocellatus]